MKVYSHLLCIVLGCLLLARGTVCDKPKDTCDTDCKPPVTEKENYGRDISGGVTNILNGVVQLMRSKFFDDSSFTASGWGLVGSSIIDGVLGIIGMHKKGDKSAWVVHRIEVYLDTMREDLICEMKNIMGSTFDKYLANEDLASYNHAMDAMQTAWGTMCYTRSCLNETQRDPVNRTEGCCIPPYDVIVDTCKTAMEKQPDKVRTGDVYCTAENGQHGVCGSDSRCHICHDFDAEIQETTKFLDQYKFSPDTNFGENILKYNGSDGFLAEAKASTFMILLYQHLHLLGSDERVNEQMKSFAYNVYLHLKKRYDQLNSMEHIKELIEGASIPPYNVNKSSIYCSFDGATLMPTMDIHNQAAARLRAGCENNSDYYMIPTGEGCGNCTAENLCYCDIQSCPAQQNVKVTFCDGHRCNAYDHADYQTKLHYDTYFEKYMWQAWGQNVMYQACGKEGVTDRYELMLNDAYGLMSRKIFDATKNLSSIMENFRNIYENGMPNNSFGFYRTNRAYPRGTCPKLTGPE